MPLSRVAFALVLASLLTGCVSNMDDLKLKLGAVDPPPTFLPPLARAAANATSALVEMPLRFTAEGSKDPQNLPLTYTWRFGDDGTAQGAEVTHAFDKVGEYGVHLSVTNVAGLVDDATVIVNVLPGNHKPIATIDVQPTRAKMGDKIAFDAARSHDADGDSLSYAWDFGDGSTALTPQASHAYAAPGIFTVRLRVSDPSGASSEATALVTIEGAWHYTGAFALGDSTAQTRQVQVAEGATHLSVLLTFPAGVGNDLTLVAKDATGREVARSAPPPMGAPAKPDDTQTRTLELGKEKLGTTGTWTLVIESAMSPTGVAWVLDARETFA